MSYESEIAAILDADGTLDALLTGGIYVSATVGPLGITRETTPSAFDSNDYLKPCALVKEAAIVPTGDVLDFDAQIESARQRVEIWLYADSSAGYSTLDTVALRIRALLMGETLTASFDLQLVLWRTRDRDNGALNGAALERLDWQVDFVMA